MPLRLRDHLPFMGNGASPFVFLDTGPLVDGELELVQPARQWIDAVMAACRHPLTMGEAPVGSEMSRRQIEDYLDACPGGRQQADPANHAAPGYYFWMHLRDNRELPIGGGVGLRVADTYDLAMYTGHIGYHVYPAVRGHRYAERACRLLLPVAKRHGLNPVWITCNPDNHASRRTCERLGGQLVEIVPVPVDHLLYQRGEKEKCRYRIDIG